MKIWFSKRGLTHTKKKFILIMTTIAVSLSSCTSTDKDYAINNRYDTSIEQTFDNQQDVAFVQPTVIPTKEAIQEKEETIPEVVYATPTVEPEDIKTINLLAVGDNLIHGYVYKNGKLDDGTYNFDSFFANIKDELTWADIKVINQETILVSDEKDYSGYPTFGGPYAVGDAIVNAGFNVVLHATNHTLDKGVSGIEQTQSFWKKYKDQVTVLGIHEDQSDYDTIKVIEVNGIKIAMLNYTYGLNGLVLPSNKQYLVDTLNDKEKVADDIRESDSLADLTIVFVHWGTQYVYDETEYQSDYANLMAEAGADLIIGAHPHVVEPLRYITTSDDRIVPVYYSLGNFISNQDKKNRMLGAMAKVVITDDSDEITLSCEIEPTVTQIEDDKPYTAYMLEDYTDKLGEQHIYDLTLNYLYDTYNNIVENENRIEPKVYIKK